jgi:hypothetical protein
VTDDPPKDPPPAPEAPPSSESTSDAPPSAEPTSEAPPSLGSSTEPVSDAQPSVVVSGELSEPGPAPAAPADDAILPPAYSDAALRDAVGAPPPRLRRKRKSDEDDGAPRPASKRGMLLVGLVLLTALVIATFALLGHANAQRYAITCATDRVSAERGRSFPPWGTHPLIGAEWRPIALPPNAECKPRETDDRNELERWYLELLIDRASTTLSSRDLLEPVPTGTANPLDTAADQLNQALLLSRAPERRDERKEVERLLGDVTYWRASLRLRDATAGLADAARQFEAAAAQRPRHVTDAGEWAGFLHRLVDELHAGPAGVPAAPGPVEPPSEHAPAPPGEALPVEPEPEPEAEPAAPPDAGLPTGGVLL